MKFRLRNGHGGTTAEAGGDATRPGVDVMAPVFGEILRPGDVVGAYRVQAELGRGGMGVVYRAEHRHLGRALALKVLSPQFATDPAFRERFMRESRIAASLQHPNIVTVHDAGEADGHVYLAMQLVEGDDLQARLARGPLDPREAVEVLAQVASALDVAHAAGLVHRDVKPGNVLLDGTRAYLTDFGLTKRANSRTALTATGQVVGTTDYLAPEQVEGRPLDARTDVYALTCVLHACLAGTPPFPRDSDVAVMFAHLQAPPPSVHAIRSELPKTLDDVVARGMAKRPAARYPSCSALMADALRALDAPGAIRRTDGSPRVLVAADAAARSIVRASLGTGEFRLEEIPAGAAAIAAVRADPPAVLLLSVRAGDVAALDALRRVSEEPATAGVRTVALVPRGQEALEEAALRAGAASVLGMPFSAVQLVVAVRAALESAGE